MGRAACSAASLRVGEAISSSFLMAGLELRRQKGSFSAEGLDITISALRGDGQLQHAFAAGALEFGLGSGPAMGYAAEGVPDFAVASLAGEPSNIAPVAANG